MPSTEERLGEIERLIAQLHKDQQELARRDRLHDEHITIMLGQIVTLVPEVNRLHERLDMMDARLDEQSLEMATHTMLLNQHTDLLQEILARLPAPGQK
jgi:ParB-like chromosome segregation protein Spo0J